MTIAAAYLTSEGVVLGADSTTQVSIALPGGGDQRAVAQLFNHAQKVFEVGENSRLGVCTWGSGRVLGTSHRTIVARLADRVTADTTVASAAQALVEIAGAAFKEQAAPDEFPGELGYFVGGWDPQTHVPHCFQINFSKDGQAGPPNELAKGEARFSGAFQFFSRVYHGFDPVLPQLLLGHLKKECPNLPPGLDEAFQKAFQQTAGGLVSQGYRDVPIREAIDFIHTYLVITIKAYKFKYGAYPAGGPVEIGFVTTDRKFRWVCHKSFSSAIFEQETEWDG